MADISKIQTKGETYDIKDEEARDDIASLNDDLTNNGMLNCKVYAPRILNAQASITFSGRAVLVFVGSATNDGSIIYCYGDRVYNIVSNSSSYFTATANGDGSYTFQNPAASTGSRYIVFEYNA